MALDSVYYGQLVWAPWSFLRNNVLDNVSSFYGVNSWHWYLTLGIPSLVTLYTPYCLVGFHRALRMDGLRGVALACAVCVVVFSMLAHKESRFFQLLVPWLHFFAVLGMSVPQTAPVPWKKVWWTLPHFVRWALLVQLPCLVYLCAWHANAQVRVMSYLQAEMHGTTPPASVGMLMPCHSTPWQSHMHAAALERSGPSGDTGLAWFLACPPPRQGQQDYWDQTDFFFDDPALYLRSRFPESVDPAFPPMSKADFRRVTGGSRTEHDLGWFHTWPSHLVVFDSLLSRPDGNSTVGGFLAAKGYHEKARFWNALFHPDEHRKGDVLVLQHYSASAFGSVPQKAA